MSILPAAFEAKSYATNRGSIAYWVSTCERSNPASLNHNNAQGKCASHPDRDATGNATVRDIPLKSHDQNSSDDHGNKNAQDNHTEVKINTVKAENVATCAPWIVFLPGLTADHRLFAKQVEHFAPLANCLVWDAPAHCESRPFPLDFTLDDWAR